MRDDFTKRAAYWRCIDVAKNSETGLSSLELSRQVGFGQTYVAKIMAEAQKNGLIETVRVGIGTKWANPQVAQRLRGEREEKRLAVVRRKSQYKREQMRLLRERIAKEEAEDAYLIPTQRWTDCAKPLPFVCKAPASVFSLGAA